MPQFPRLRVPLALGAIGAAAALAATAGAAAPPPCGGKPLATDKAGDQTIKPLALTDEGSKKGPDNADIVGAWLATEGGVTTANIQVANASDAAPPPNDSQGGLYWYTHFVADGATRYVFAHATTAGVDYGYGTYSSGEGTYLDDGTTEGSITEGANGVVSVVIPADIAKPGLKLSSINFMVDAIAGGPNHAAGLNNNVDSAPDSTTTPSDPSKFAYTVGPCAAGTTPTATPTPTPGTGGGSTGGGSTGGGSTGTAPASTTLPVRFDGVIGKAKKAKKKATFKFNAQSDKQITGLKLTLKKGNGKGAALATGKAATLKAGTSKVSIKLKKKLKKGIYSLQATGTVDGKKLAVGQKVQIK